jgi:hypothetical protein
VPPLANLENCIYPPGRHSHSSSLSSSLTQQLPHSSYTAAGREPSSKPPCRRAPPRTLASLPWPALCSLRSVSLQQDAPLPRRAEAAPMAPISSSLSLAVHGEQQNTHHGARRLSPSSAAAAGSCLLQRAGTAGPPSSPSPSPWRDASAPCPPLHGHELHFPWMASRKIFQLLPRRPFSPRARSSRSHFPCSALFVFRPAGSPFSHGRTQLPVHGCSSSSPWPTPLLGQQPSRPCSPARSPLRSSSRTFPAQCPSLLGQQPWHPSSPRPAFLAMSSSSDVSARLAALHCAANSTSGCLPGVCCFAQPRRRRHSPR